MKCPVCGSSKGSEYGVRKDFKAVLYWKRCSSCESIYQDPLPRNYKEFYTKDYYSGKADYAYLDERKTAEYSNYVWQDRLKVIRRYQEKGIFLDVGCSFGGFVRAASSVYESYGIDVSGYAVKKGNTYARKAGVKENFKGLAQGSLTDFPLKNLKKSSVSIISLIEVAEHLFNPPVHFKKAYQLLMPGGVLIIQTANITAWQAEREGIGYHYFLPGHLTCFSRKGLLGALKEAGFSRVDEYFPVEFGLLAKLKKMKGDFQSPLDYFRWIRTSWYHFLSFFAFKKQSLTSSYVVYAVK